LTNALLSAERCLVTKDSVYLAVLSTSHDYPLCQPGILGTLLKGGKCVLAKTASAEEAFAYIKKENVTFTQVVPVIAGIWVDAAKDENINDIKLDYVQVGAAKLEWELAKKIEECFCTRIIQGYGLGEGITCFTSPTDEKETAWKTMGKPISEADEIKIIDESGKEAEPGEAGELWEKGPYTFFGYYKAPERNKDLFSKDGYLKTGDKAMIDEEDNVVILGRVKEQINRAGENIIPEEIESFITKWEYSTKVSVIGVEDEQLGEATCAVMEEGKEKKSLEELCEFLSTLKIARFKYPDHLVYVDKIPYINVGKVDKKKLKKMVQGKM
nr:AMP-binding protein [Parasporobacterium sp.]